MSADTRAALMGIAVGLLAVALGILAVGGCTALVIVLLRAVLP